MSVEITLEKFKHVSNLHLSARRQTDWNPYLSICLIVRNCERTLPGGLQACFESIKERAPDAEIVVVDTLSSDDTAKVSKQFADVYVEYKGPRGDWTYAMDWFDDAATSRQLSFELASGKWRMWIDADDILPGPEETQRLLEVNGRLEPKRAGVNKLDAPKKTSLEDLLKHVEKVRPQISCVWAPYLYRSDDSGRALRWQERERIIKWDDNWRWSEQAHEILVPINPRKAGETVYFEHLLFVHKKLFTNEDEMYSIRRHWNVILKKYEAGEITTRNCRYLAAYASIMNPQRHEEFLNAGYKAAVLPLERHNALLEYGNYQAGRGFYQDALEHYAAATASRPDLPDAWLAGGKLALESEDYIRAIDWLRKAVNMDPNYVDSFVNPRDHVVAVPVLLAQALEKLAKQQIKVGMHKEAEDCLKEAWNICFNLSKNSIIGPDLQESQLLANRMKNTYESQKTARAIHDQWDFLRRNDETIKASRILKAIPHTLEDHPLIVAIENWTKALDKHLTDAKAYNDFYVNLETSTDSIPTTAFDANWLTPEGCLSRAKFLIDWIRTNRGDKPTTILEIGSYDGIIGVPVLTACPNVRYVAVDAQQVALDRFECYAKEKVPDGTARLTTICQHFLEAGAFIPEPGTSLAKRNPWADIVVAFEIFEHVPNPVAFAFALRAHIKPDGRLFVSTPAGAYDNGSPEDSEIRDPRGHVRAMTARDVVGALRKSGADVEELVCQHMSFELGNTFVAMAKDAIPKGTPIAFAVPSALWDWNSRLVHNTGIGASEETIVYLAAELAKTKAVEVYGPVPEAEVHKGVAYWPREQFRYVKSDTKIVVSRAPLFGAQLDKVAGATLSKVLWLQDAYYEGFDAEVASAYEKIVVLTNWHREAMREFHDVPFDKMVCINNFLLKEHFEIAKSKRPERLPHHFIYASSPDRGLIPLLELWPKILSLWPDATLAIFYGWEGCKKLAHASPEWIKTYRKIRDAYDRLKHQKGIIEVGRINHPNLALEFMRASAWLYPCRTFHEAGCLTAIKAKAAGAVPVTTPRGALIESAASEWTQFIAEDLPDFEDCFIEGVKKAVETCDSDRVTMAKEAIEQHSLEARMPAWLSVLKKA